MRVQGLREKVASAGVQGVNPHLLVAKFRDNDHLDQRACPVDHAKATVVIHPRQVRVHHCKVKLLLQKKLLRFFDVACVGDAETLHGQGPVQVVPVIPGLLDHEDFSNLPVSGHDFLASSCNLCGRAGNPGDGGQNAISNRLDENRGAVVPLFSR